MPISLFRIDERLLHGQVVVGWGRRLEIAYYVVVDDLLVESEWEQELYASGLPAGTAVSFVSVADAVDRFPELDANPGRGALLTRGTLAMRRLAAAGLLTDRRVNIGGLHAEIGRRRALDYVFLKADEAEDLRTIRQQAASVSARDLPTSREVSLDEVLDVLG
jgi:PTS system mannose-specific IIB component/fructoselysine and glucoselysine-specific PTS system IIB component